MDENKQTREHYECSHVKWLHRKRWDIKRILKRRRFSAAYRNRRTYVSDKLILRAHWTQANTLAHVHKICINCIFHGLPNMYSLIAKGSKASSVYKPISAQVIMLTNLTMTCACALLKHRIFNGHTSHDEYLCIARLSLKV